MIEAKLLLSPAEKRNLAPIIALLSTGSQPFDVFDGLDIFDFIPAPAIEIDDDSND